MAKIVEIDNNVKFSSQLEEDVGSVVFVNKFSVKPEDFDKLLKAWEADAKYFKSHAIWESTTHFKKTVYNTDFDTLLSNYPASTIVSPHIFNKVAVPGICVGE